jgi:hypothetical protein
MRCPRRTRPSRHGAGLDEAVLNPFRSPAASAPPAGYMHETENRADEPSLTDVADLFWHAGNFRFRRGKTLQATQNDWETETGTNIGDEREEGGEVCRSGLCRHVLSGLLRPEPGPGPAQPRASHAALRLRPARCAKAGLRPSQDLKRSRAVRTPASLACRPSGLSRPRSRFLLAAPERTCRHRVEPPLRGEKELEHGRQRQQGDPDWATG